MPKGRGGARRHYTCVAGMLPGEKEKWSTNGARNRERKRTTFPCHFSSVRTYAIESSLTSKTVLYQRSKDVVEVQGPPG